MIWAAAGELAAESRNWQKARTLFQKVIDVEGPHPVFTGKLRSMCKCAVQTSLAVVDAGIATQEREHKLQALRGRILLGPALGRGKRAYESALTYAPDVRTRQRYHQAWGNLTPAPGQVKAAQDRPLGEAARRRFGPATEIVQVQTGRVVVVDSPWLLPDRQVCPASAGRH